MQDSLIRVLVFNPMQGYKPTTDANHPTDGYIFLHSLSDVSRYHPMIAKRCLENKGNERDFVKTSARCSPVLIGIMEIFPCST